MLNAAILGVFLFLGGVPSPPAQVLRQPCLHEPGRETAAERVRRQRAIAFAQLLNRAEAIAGGPGGRNPYRQPDDLTNVPAVPDGFRLQFHTDGETYTFSLKDERDSCGYSIFSDQESFIYEATPMLGGRVIPAETDPRR